MEYSENDEDPAGAWRCLPVVMVRLPMLDPHALTGLPDDNLDRLNSLWALPELREALVVSAPQLARKLDCVGSGTRPDAVARLARTLFKYALRMSTRATPLGLFAATGFAEWGPGPLAHSPGNSTRSARFDGVVMGDLVRTIEARVGLPNLTLSANPSVLRSDGGTRIQFQPPGLEVMLSCRWTPALEAALRFAATPRSEDDMRRFLGSADPDAHVRALLKQGLLVSSLRPSPPHYFDARALCAAAGSEDQSRINPEDLAEFESADPGQGADSVGRVSATMGLPTATSISGVQVDLIMTVDGSVDIRLRERLAQALRGLQRFAMAENPDPVVAAYADAFAERFGHEEVPLPDLLDSISGLGPLPRREKGPTPDDGHRDRLRLAIVRRAMDGQGFSAAVAEKDLAALPVVREGARSCDIFLQIIRQRRGSSEPVAVLTPRGVVTPGGRSFARFARLDARVAPHVGSCVAEDMEAHPDVIFAGVDYWHDTMVGLAAGPLPYDHLLLWSSISSETPLTTLRPADLLVGWSRGRLYLRSRIDGRRVVVRPHHLVNTDNAPLLIDFAIRVSAADVATPGWNWGDFERTSLALPRVTMAGVIVCPARWRVDDTDPPSGEQVNAWRTQSGVPRMIHMADGDAGLLLDLDDPHQRELLAKQSTRGPLWVSEACLEDGEEQQRHPEVVVSLLNMADRTPAQPLPDRPGRAYGPDQVTAVSSPRMPGDGWWAAHVRTTSVVDENTFLKLMSVYFGASAQWFFVRYDYPRRHLRVRVRSDDVSLDEFCDALRRIGERRVVHGFSIEPYHPETQRYGGKAALAACEELFCTESKATVVCVHALTQHVSHSSRDHMDLGSVSATVIHHYLATLGAPPRVRTDVLKIFAQTPDRTETHQPGRRVEHAQRRLLTAALSPENGVAPHWLVEWQTMVAGILVPPMVQKVIESPSGELVAASLVHMHLNRLGVGPDWERVGAQRLLAVRHALALRGTGAGAGKD